MNVPDIFELVNMCLYDTVHIREFPVKHPYFLFQAPIGTLTRTRRFREPTGKHFSARRRFSAG